MKDKNGITLVALIVTIIVLLILTGVSIAALTGDNGLLTKANESAKKSDLESAKEDIKLQILAEIASNNGTNLSNEALKSILEKYGTLEYESDGTTVKGVVTTKGDEILLSDLGTTSINSLAESDTTGMTDGGWNGTVNSPKLVTGMTGVYWDGSGNEVIVTADNQENWYDYGNKKWANAKTADGSYFVWIPRYEYKIPTTHTNTTQIIDVNFIQNTSTTVDSGYTMHPGFTFGTTELSGIWVAKFEASGTESAIDSKPNANSLRYITISTIFDACRNMETNSRYGWGTIGTEIDTHLMKNIEWGACVYLSSSQYGKTGEVWVNSDGNLITGKAGSTYNYNDLTYGINASTTGNIYGIYDMSGGVWEYTAAYVNNGNSYLNTYGASLINADVKYKDVYTSSGDTQTGNYEASSTRKGDAVYETSNIVCSWYNDYSYMPYSSLPFFVRGGYVDNGNNAGIYAFYGYYGNNVGHIGFRPSIVFE